MDCSNSTFLTCPFLIEGMFDNFILLPYYIDFSVFNANSADSDPDLA